MAGGEVCSYLGRLANLLADSLPFVVLVLLYGIEKSGALRNHCQHLKRPQETSTEFDRRSQFRRFVPRLRRTLRSACPIAMSAAVLVGVEGAHLGCPTNLVPVLLHAALRTGGKRLRAASVTRGA